VREPHKDGGAKFQPLRSQQLQQLKGGATSPTRNRLRDEHKEAQPASSSEGSSTQLALTAGDGASADSSASDGSVSAALLFEDTLVISGRPVLVRVSELASPSRLEVRVFDPYSSLEYDLSLPLTFVRMCMYQVPDLLLQHNRKYLVQTLLHYLVFVQTDAQAGGSGGGNAGLELLVDIVAPPPRNAVEAAAWARVQEEAAMEQASWELDNEREAARARRELQRQQSHSHTQEQTAQVQTAQSEQETEQKEQEQPLEQPEESDELTQSTEAQSTAAADGTQAAADESAAPSNDSSVAEAVSDAALTDSAAAGSSADSAQPAAASSSSDSAIDK